MCCGFEAAIDHLFWVCLLIVGFLFNLELVVDFEHQGSGLLLHSCRQFSITVGKMNCTMGGHSIPIQWPIWKYTALLVKGRALVPHLYFGAMNPSKGGGQPLMSFPMNASLRYSGVCLPKREVRALVSPSIG
uniref:Uncharacterized protein n=1 Tax=Opuntia streptacantha TaxID=393608 RepID=A0A7C9AC41_OPUST